MTRTRTFDVGGVNLKVHTRHTPSEYVELWQTLYRMRGTVLWGPQAMMIGEAQRLDPDDPESPIFGHIYKFLNIDPSDPWFDIQKKKPATDEDVSQVSIPDFLKPNLRFVPYLFLPKKHRLYLITKAGANVSDSMAASTAGRMLEKLSERERIVKRFGRVEINVLKNKKAVEDLLEWQVIKRLEIYIERPNALEDEDEQAILDRLEGMRAESQQVVYKKASGAKTLVPDRRLKTLAMAAADNGEVKVVGRNKQGIKDTASSKQFPLHETATYEPSKMTLTDAFKTFVLGTLAK
ncbi:DUF4747 family protein [Achromobacter insuavis]|uniref:DUF4747 family protein n=1 Tax=Achromobacter insuavis TaxID=1287735 RepID=UPI001EEA87C7|nr:DUF4747 family protein [Achromobacter insuavis]